MTSDYAVNVFLNYLFGFLIIYSIFIIALMVFSCICMWKIFEKAGIEGWKSLIPLYSTYLLFKLSWGEGWFFLLLYVPIANWVVLLIVSLKIAQSFGQETIFGVGLFFLAPVFYGILAFNSKMVYCGVAEESTGHGSKKRNQENYNNDSSYQNWYDEDGE